MNSIADVIRIDVSFFKKYVKKYVLHDSNWDNEEGNGLLFRSPGKKEFLKKLFFTSKKGIWLLRALREAYGLLFLVSI